MDKRGFTLIELLAVIIILAVVVIVTTPKVNDFILEKKKKSFVTSAKNFSRELQYREINSETGEKISVHDLDLNNVVISGIDIYNSFVYFINGEMYIDLAGIDQYENMYVCGINYAINDIYVQSTPCK